MTDDPRALAAQLLAASRYAMPLQEALEHVRVRRGTLCSPPAAPEPDFSAPEATPLPIIDAPELFAAAFWNKRSPAKPAPPSTTLSAAGDWEWTPPPVSLRGSTACARR